MIPIRAMANSAITGGSGTLWLIKVDVEDAELWTCDSSQYESNPSPLVSKLSVPPSVRLKANPEPIELLNTAMSPANSGAPGLRLSQSRTCEYPLAFSSLVDSRLKVWFTVRRASW